MSVEALLERIATAIEANTVELAKNTAGRGEAIAAAQAVAAAPKTTRAAAKKDEPKPVDYTGEKGFEEFKKLAGGWMAAGGDETESEIRKALFIRILAKFDATKLGNLPEDKRAVAAGWINTLIAGENVEELAEPEKPASDGLLD